MAKDARKQYMFTTHPITLLCVGFATVYLLFQTYTIFARKSYTEELLSKSSIEKHTLVTEYEKSQERINLLSRSLGKDMFQREKQNYIEEGEEIYVIVQKKILENATTTIPQESWIQKLVPFY